MLQQGLGRNGLRAARSFASLWPVAFTCIIPVLAHMPEFLGIVHTNPLLFVSDLALKRNSSLLGGSPFIDGNAGLTTMALGRLVADDWLHGHLPWWNPYTGVGLPLAAEMQPAAFFLPFVLLLHFKSGVLYLKVAMQILAGLGMLGFLRCLKVSLWSACLGGILFQLNGTFAWYADAPFLPIAFLPLLLWGLERTYYLVGQDRRGGEALIAVAIAGSLLAGFPETAFVDGLMGLGWALTRLLSIPRQLARVFARRVVTGGLAGVALASPAVLPFVASLPISSVGPHDFSIAAHLGPAHVAALLFPYMYGPIGDDIDLSFWAYSGGYIGTLPPLLALYALAWRGQAARPTRYFLVAWLVILLPAMFHLPVLTPLVRLIPGVKLVFLCRYGLPSVEMAICILAALSLDDIFCGVVKKSWRVPACCLAACIVVGLILAGPKLLNDMRSDVGGTRFALASIGWGIGSAVVLILLIDRPMTRRRSRGIYALLIIDSLALFTTATLSGLTDGRVADEPNAFLQRHQGLSRAFSTDSTLFPNYGAMLKLNTLAYDYTPVPSLWSDYVRAHLDPATTPVVFPSLGESSWDQALLVSARYQEFAAIGVRYVVAPRSVNLFAWTGADGPRRVFRNERTDVFELPHPRPYAEIVQGACRLEIAEREIMHASCQTPARLVRRELFYPGWKARVNGHHAGIELQDNLFQAIELAPGESDIVWRYGPPFSRTMGVLFFCSLGTLIVLFWRERQALR